MPLFPELRISALEDLAAQLRFAPPAALRKDLERAEALAAEIDAELTYPEDWVVFRVTGYRPEIDEPAMIVGAALLSDLSALVERLSDAARITWEELGPGAWLDVEGLGARWSVSKKTLDRYRRKGLIARRVLGDRGMPKLAFSIEAIERFETNNPNMLKRAAGFDRIEPVIEERMIRRARRYEQRLGYSLNEAAARLAERFGRSHEGVRKLLQRAQNDEAIFDDPGWLTGPQRKLAFRADRRGVDPGRIAARLGKSRGTVHRAINERRAELLNGLRLSWHLPRKMCDDPTAASLLEAGPAKSGLGQPGQTDLLAFVEDASLRHVPIGVEESARAQAYQYLLFKSDTLIARLGHIRISATLLDEIETMLQWAARLKTELVRQELALMVDTFEERLGCPLSQVRSEKLRKLVSVAMQALADGVDKFDPFRGGRLAAPVGLSVSHAAAQWVKTHGLAPAGRAAPVLKPGIEIADWTRAIAPWQRWLEPDRRVLDGLEAVAFEDRVFLEARFGWDGSPPRTLEEMAKVRGTSVLAAGTFGRGAMKRVRGKGVGNGVGKAQRHEGT